MGARDAGKLLITLCALLAYELGGAAEAFPADSTLGDSILVLPEVRVDESRVGDAERRAPSGFVTEIRPGARGGAVDLLPDLLAQAAGVHVQQYGGLGAFSVVSVRGASPGQVAVFLNGMPFTAAGRGVVNLADLPVTAIERIEVYRGSSPLAFGLAGAGGAVNLVTFGGPHPPQLRVAHGSFDTWDARGFASGTLGDLNGLVHVSYQGSEGDYQYLDDNATPFNLVDDGVTTRLNNRFDAWNGLASLGWRPHPELEVVARGDVLARRQGTPGLGALPTRHTHLAGTYALAQLEASAAARGVARPRVAVRGGLDGSRLQFSDPSAELGLGAHDSDDRLTANHLDLELEWARLPASLAVEAGGTLRQEQADLHDPADPFPDPPPSRRERSGLMAALAVRPLSGRVLIRAGARWETIQDELHASGAGGATARSVERSLRSPQVGLRITPGLGLELRANASQTERPPDFLELFGNQGLVLGNPALGPESLENWDAGGSWASPPGSPVRASLTLAHFESRAQDLILYVRNSASTVRAQNVSSARVLGEELEVGLGIAGLAANFTFTWQQAVDTGDIPYWTGRRLPQRPGREGYGRLAWARHGLELGADVYYLGDNYLDRYNRYRVESRTLAGAWVSMSPRGWPLRLSFEGKNLGDQRTADVAGFPLPGRTVFVACETRLGHAPR